MEKPLQLMLRLESFRFRAPRQWWKEGNDLERLFNCVRAADLWLAFDHAGEEGGPLKHFDSMGQLGAARAEWERGSYTLQRGKSDDPECFIRLEISSSRLVFRFFVSGEELERLRDTLLDRFINLTTRLHEAYHDSATLGRSLGVEIFDLAFPRVRPPREQDFWAYGDAVDFICREFHETSPQGTPDTVRRLLDAPMPEGTERTEKGDLVIFRWIDTLSDGDHVAQRRSAQEQWLVSILNPPPSSDYNAAGDRLEVALTAESKPPLTFYDPGFETGYKATALSPDGTVDEELFEEMAGWVGSRQLPDGTPLRQLNLILPNRESALRVRERALAIGAGNVFYADDDGRWWNPFPPGLWRE